MKKTSILTLSLFILTAVVLTCGTAAAVEVNTIAELQSNVSGATGDLIIQLGDNFPRELTNVISLTLNNDANVTIVGGSKTDLMTIKQTANTKHFNLADSSSTAANIEFKNIEFVGGIPDSVLDSDSSFNGSTNHNALPGGGGISGGTKGKTAFENCVFKQIRGEVLSGSANVILKNTTFISNSGNHRIIISTGNYLEIENCSFVYNYANGWGGHCGGLIYLTGNAKCNITNTVFAHNVFLGGGNVQGGGGVLGIAYGSVSSYLNIIDSVFENNTVDSLVPANKDFSTTADGGALYFYNMLGEITIQESSFLNNTAFDEGGAISFIGSNNTNNRIENSLFYGNIAEGKQPSDGVDGGGAFELANIYLGSLKYQGSNLALEGNTIVKNQAEKGVVTNNYGGGLSINSFCNVSGTNNIISGNKATNYNNIYGTARFKDNGGNVIDKNIENVFGLTDPEPVEIGSKKAGDPKSAFYGVIKTIPLNPEDDAFNNGLKPSHSNTSLLVDQNDKLRNENTPSSGSVELQYVKYDLKTEGEWKAGEFTQKVDKNDTANGTIIDRACEFKSSDYYYQLVFEDGTDTPVTSRIPIHKTDPSKMFLWWVNETDEKTTETNGSKNTVLTPVWGDLEYTVIFRDHDGTELKKESVLPGNDATAPADPVRLGYVFTGWDKDFTNVQSDLTVTAQYKEETKTIDKPGSGRNSPKSAMGGEKEGYEIEEIIPEIIKPILVILFFVIAIACYFYVRSTRD